MNSSYQDVETARTIQISFDNTIAEAKLFEPTFGSTEATASFPRGNSITLSVPDHVVVLEITPSEATDTVAPPAPLNLMVI